MRPYQIIVIRPITAAMQHPAIAPYPLAVKPAGSGGGALGSPVRSSKPPFDSV